MSQVNFRGTGIQLEGWVCIHRLPERNGYLFYFFFCRRLDVELSYSGADVLIVIDEPQHTFFSMIFESVGNTGKRFFVEGDVEFFVRQYRVIAPDNFLPPYFIGETFKDVYSFSNRRQVVF